MVNYQNNGFHTSHNHRVEGVNLSGAMA